MNNRKIAIIGAADLTRDKSTIKRIQDYELWSLNNLFIDCEGIQFDRWFELHHFTRRGSRYIRRGQDNYGNFSTIKEYLQAINELDTLVYMQKPLAPIKKSVKYPFQNVMRTFKTKYFGCSFAWMIALALYEHLNGQPITEIRLFGAHLTTYEYYFQRPSTEYFLGMAQGMGIKLRMSNSCNLLKAPWIYAYKENFNLIDTLYVGIMKELLTMASIPMQRFFESIYYE